MIKKSTMAFARTNDAQTFTRTPHVIIGSLYKRLLWWYFNHVSMPFQFWVILSIHQPKGDKDDSDFPSTYLETLLGHGSCSVRRPMVCDKRVALEITYCRHLTFHAAWSLDLCVCVYMCVYWGIHWFTWTAEPVEPKVWTKGCSSSLNTSSLQHINVMKRTNSAVPLFLAEKDWYTPNPSFESLAFERTFRFFAWRNRNRSQM